MFTKIKSTTLFVISILVFAAAGASAQSLDPPIPDGEFTRPLGWGDLYNLPTVQLFEQQLWSNDLCGGFEGTLDCGKFSRRRI